MENKEIVTAPVCGWEFKTVPGLDAVMVQFSYLVSPMETPDQAHRTPFLIVHTPQLRELAQTIERILRTLGSSGAPPAPGPRH